MNLCKHCGEEIRMDAFGTWYHRRGVRVECIPKLPVFVKAEPA